MSKKIIYLLSLFMVLSLIFASCKDDNGLNPTKDFTNGGSGGSGNGGSGSDIVTNITGGTVDNWEDLEGFTNGVIQNYPVIDESTTGNDYYRNPVIVSLGHNQIIIVAEKRVGYKGSENDIGVNGSKQADIVYFLSSNGGDSINRFDIAGGASSSGGANSVCSPVVYYKKSDNNNGMLYIIASSGAGLSRAAGEYSTRYYKSKLRYITASVAVDRGYLNLGWGYWQDLVTDDNFPNTQFGTHAARGVIASDGSLILPIITADLGTTSNPKENMGVRFYKVNANGTTLTLGAQIGQNIDFKDNTSSFSKYKEVQAVAYNTSSGVTYLAVPSPSRDNYTMGKGTSANSIVTTLNGLSGSEGSFGFLKLTNAWYGAQKYNPTTYSTSPSTAGNSFGTKASTEILFSHVESEVGASYLYMLNDTTYTPKSGRLQIAETSKSSSIDVLPDGTIIMAAEKERNTTADGNKFSIFFSRYTQKYIAENIK